MITLSRLPCRLISRFLACALMIGLLNSCSDSEQPNTMLIDNIQGYSFNNQRELFSFPRVPHRQLRGLYRL